MKFVLVSEKYAQCFNEKVQRYLDEGYELKGETFTTTVTLYKTVEYYFNQVLVKNGEKESEEWKLYDSTYLESIIDKRSSI